jgi:multidrug resistance efflux pump
MAEQRGGVLRRHLVAVGMAVLILAVAAAGGYVYLDYAGRFQSTDDAFIAARQFVVAPKVSGYVTAVPVTDNQHVVAGGVIARLDDRDYRLALEQVPGVWSTSRRRWASSPGGHGPEHVRARRDVGHGELPGDAAHGDAAWPTGGTAHRRAPDRVILGHVASVQPNSGIANSLLRAENATGTYVKIVLRVPVRS